MAEVINLFRTIMLNFIWIELIWKIINYLEVSIMARMFITFYPMSVVQISGITYFSEYIMILFVFKKGKEMKDSETCFDKHFLLRDIIGCVVFNYQNREHPMRSSHLQK